MEYLAASFFSDRISGDGPFSRRCVDALSAHLRSERVLLTPSCTSALEMSALFSGVGPGDEVIVPSFTFVSSANAFLLFGATPMFADIDPVRFNVTPESIFRALTPRTKAVVVVHYGGISCDMLRIRRLCDEHGLILIEDCAHALFASSCGRPLGTYGDLATFSFHETKNVTCGEGGALLVNREDWWDRALIVREKGTDRTRFMLGEVDKYTWVDRGSSYLLADPLAAIVLAQLEFVDVIQARRKQAWLRYAAELPRWAKSVGAQLPTEADDGDVSPYHLFPMLLADNDMRDRFLAHCKEPRRHVGVPLPAACTSRGSAASSTPTPTARSRSTSRAASPGFRSSPTSRPKRSSGSSMSSPRSRGEAMTTSCASVSVVVPVYNNEASLDELVQRLVDRARAAPRSLRDRPRRRRQRRRLVEDHHPQRATPTIASSGSTSPGTSANSRRPGPASTAPRATSPC